MSRIVDTALYYLWDISPVEGILLHENFADRVALTTDNYSAFSGSGYTHTLEIEVFNGSFLNVNAIDTINSQEFYRLNLKSVIVTYNGLNIVRTGILGRKSETIVESDITVSYSTCKCSFS